jgi:hypothetical protein
LACGCRNDLSNPVHGLSLLVNVQARFTLPKQFATDCDSYNNSMKVVKSQGKKA